MFFVDQNVKIKNQQPHLCDFQCAFKQSLFDFPWINHACKLHEKYIIHIYLYIGNKIKFF